MNRNKLIFFIIWALVLLVGPITVLKNTPSLFTLLNSQTAILNILQRTTGLLVFSLIFSQIILGAFMDILTDKLGGWVFDFHKTQGIITYLLALSHPLLFALFKFKISGHLNLFYPFTDICVLCENNLEIYYTLGRISIWLLTLTVSVALLRKEPFLRRNWRKFHILNYFIFFLVALHSWLLGSDTHASPFKYFYVIFTLGVLASIYWRIKSYIKFPKVG